MEKIGYYEETEMPLRTTPDASLREFVNKKADVRKRNPFF